MEQHKSAGLLVYYLKEEPYFLLLKYPNYWGFSKGMIEEGENEKQAAIRELKEEAGIKAEIIPGFEYKQEWFFKLKGETISKTAIFFLAKTAEEEAEKTKISFEHGDFAWLPVKVALGKMTIKNNREMLKKAYEFIIDYNKQKRLM